MNGKRAVVCGASRGIGRAVAEELARCGVEVTLVARDEALLVEVLEGLDVSQGQEHSYLSLDFKNPDKVQKALFEKVNDSAPYHILINNTGGPAPGPLSEAGLQELADGFTMHILTAQAMMSTLLPGMKSAGYGRIVNIISTSVKEPIPGLGVSNTIRGAMASWSKTLSKELGGYGITVNNLLPGFTETGRLKKIVDLKAVTAGVPIETMEERMKRDVPAGRFAKPEEVANVIRFLCSAEASYINGVNVPVDGGRTKSL